MRQTIAAIAVGILFYRWSGFFLRFEQKLFRLIAGKKDVEPFSLEKSIDWKEFEGKVIRIVHANSVGYELGLDKIKVTDFFNWEFAGNNTAIVEYRNPHNNKNVPIKVHIGARKFKPNDTIKIRVNPENPLEVVLAE